MRILTHFFNTLFPDRCVGCAERGTLLCRDCRKKLAPASNPMHSWVTSVFAYHDFRVKRLVHSLKYKHSHGAADIFAPALADALIEFLGEETMFLGSRPILVVPVPLSKKRFAKRGYNQAELLAQKMTARIPNGNIRVKTDLLKKIKETKPQVDIKKRSIRLSNLGDCFAITPQSASGGEVIVLLDDVTTTGATLTAARKALRAAGFHKIYGLAVAH